MRAGSSHSYVDEEMEDVDIALDDDMVDEEESIVPWFNMGMYKSEKLEAR